MEASVTPIPTMCGICVIDLERSFLWLFSPLFGVAAAVLPVSYTTTGTAGYVHISMCRVLAAACRLLAALLHNGRLQSSIEYTASEAAGGGR